MDDVIIYSHTSDKDGKKGRSEIRVSSVNINGRSALPADILYLIDGEETTSQDIKNINADKIESMAVYKNGDVKEKYGEKAKNGVIIEITIKK
ncbi:MAG: TonB-dependent receptor plug domain-containing protein [Prevotellaceae bacterium]|jgi:hypothetical protein|nr:TonB-dependent receptor plug domain-containing protein [Prevotellaceae bacterium]